MAIDSHDRTTTPKSRALKKSTPNTQNMKQQRSILGFFQPKSSPVTPKTSQATTGDAREPESSPAQAVANRKSGNATAATTKKIHRAGKKNDSTSNLTPAPSSDMVEPEEDIEDTPVMAAEKESAGDVEAGLPSPATSANGRFGVQVAAKVERDSATPSRRVRQLFSDAVAMG